MNEKNDNVPIEAILFIPCLYHDQPDYYLDILSKGFDTPTTKKLAIF